MKFFSTLLITLYTGISLAQTSVTIYTDSILQPVHNKFQPGCFYVPKTNEAQTDFLGNGIHQNSVRTHIIESALNNSTDLAQTLVFIDNVGAIIQSISHKTDKLVFIFEKMPAWLSSSSDGSPAQTPGWYVLNTKPPASYSNWNAMVAAVTNKLVNDLGVTNAYFEIWNEPDLGSWTGTDVEFFELFRETYQAIKSVNSSLPVGGAAVNFWANDIFSQPEYGYITNAVGDQSLIGKLIDSTTTWGFPLDFISWHNFNLTHHVHANAESYINQKYAGLGLTTPELMVSEWNAQSQVRETPVHKSFMIKNLIELAKTNIESNMVAAWQDFESTPVEFHNDYGLLSYGSIHKPAYKAILLGDKLKGDHVKYESNNPIDVITTVSNDTLNILITNYAPPAFVEALNHTLYEGQSTIGELDSAGFIDLAGSSWSPLDSIYQGLITISGTNSIDLAINNAIPTFNHFNNLENQPRTIDFTIPGISGNHSGISYLIDSTVNNSHFQYDSLLASGHTQASAITQITQDQSLLSSTVQLNNGSYSTQLQPNAVQLIQFKIPELLSLNDQESIGFIIYPNPSKGVFYIESIKNELIQKVDVIDLNGRIVLTKNYCNIIDISSLEDGTYFIRINEDSNSELVLKK